MLGCYRFLFLIGGKFPPYKASHHGDFYTAAWNKEDRGWGSLYGFQASMQLMSCQPNLSICYWEMLLPRPLFKSLVPKKGKNNDKHMLVTWKLAKYKSTLIHSHSLSLCLFCPHLIYSILYFILGPDWFEWFCSGFIYVDLFFQMDVAGLIPALSLGRTPNLTSVTITPTMLS